MHSPAIANRMAARRGHHNPGNDQPDGKARPNTKEPRSKAMQYRERARRRTLGFKRRLIGPPNPSAQCGQNNRDHAQTVPRAGEVRRIARSLRETARSLPQAGRDHQRQRSRTFARPECLLLPSGSSPGCKETARRRQRQSDQQRGHLRPQRESRQREENSRYPGFARHPRALRLAQDIDGPQRPSDLQQHQKQAERNESERSPAERQQRSP